ncbi:YfhO family protein [Bacillus gobiensis]|uniref:YfhO family protein n=1 Tax=Bacillus gobiensis TaxID=1441095 RepID=UPI003D25EEC3
MRSFFNNSSKFIVPISCTLLPIILMTFNYFLLNIYPFGDRSIFLVDLFQQYRVYFHYYHDLFHNGDSFFYSWNAALGMNQIGLFGYYLSSPFNLIMVAFSRSALPETILAVTLIKIGFSSLTMSFYLRSIDAMKKLAIVIFSVTYSLMGYAIVYAQNIMWLDALIYLPLIILGVDHIINKKSYTIYTISLSLMLISNFYLSYMVGIFTAGYFLLSLLCHKTEKKQKVRTAIRFGFGTLLSAGISFVIIFPTYLNLRNVASNRFSFDPGIHSPFLTLAKLFNGIYDTLKTNTLDHANIYTGLLTLFLVVIFFFSKKISRRDKAVFGLLAFLVYIGFEIDLFNIMWHGFTPPTWFPYRFSFIFSFLLAVMAFKTFITLDRSDRKFIWIAYGVISITLLICFLQVPTSVMAVKNVLWNFLLISLFAVVLYFRAAWSRFTVVISLCILVLVTADLSSNGWMTMKKMDREFHFRPHEDVVLNKDMTQSIKKIEEANPEGFYRISSDYKKSNNDGMLYNYPSIAHFSSVTDASLTRTMRAFGYTTQDTDKWISNTGGTLFSDAFLGTAYYISGNQNKFPDMKTLSTSPLAIFENPNAFPPGFMVNDEIEKLSDSSMFGRFEANPYTMNQLLANSVQKGANLFDRIEPKSVELVNVTKEDESTYKKIDPNREGKVILKFDSDEKNKQLYFYMRPTRINESKIFYSGYGRQTYPDTLSNGAIPLPPSNGKEKQLEIILMKDQLNIHQLELFTLNNDKLPAVAETAKENGMQFSHYDDGRFSGTIDTKEDGTLFLTVPFDKGWSVKVNGQPAEVKRVAGAFMGIDLRKGTNTIEATYISPGFITGVAVSILSLLLFIGLLVFTRRKGIAETSFSEEKKD